MKALWEKSKLSRIVAFALILFISVSCMMIGESFAKYYTANYGQDGAVVGSFVFESDVTEDQSLTASLTMTCDLARVDDKGTLNIAEDDEYFVDWRVKISNVNAQGKVSTIKTEYGFTVDLPDDAPDYLRVLAEGATATAVTKKPKPIPSPPWVFYAPGRRIRITT